MATSHAIWRIFFKDGNVAASRVAKRKARGRVNGYGRAQALSREINTSGRVFGRRRSIMSEGENMHDELVAHTGWTLARGPLANRFFQCGLSWFHYPFDAAQTSRASALLLLLLSFLLRSLTFGTIVLFQQRTTTDR